MEGENTSTPTPDPVDSAAPDRSTQTEPQAEPAAPETGTASGARDDDRNEEVGGSPVPDPEANDTDAQDDPQAD
jgi:hypothetical protein